MKPWVATALLFLLAVPYQTFWPDYEAARRGALAVLVGLICWVPGLMPRRSPTAIWPMNALALWTLVRSVFVTNTGYALEASCHTIALAALMVLGTGMTLRHVLRAALPTGTVVALVGIAQGFGWSLIPDTTEAVSTLGNRNVASELLTVCGAAAALLLSLADSSRGERRAALLTLVCCGVAVVLNGSRSGLVALPVGCLFCLFQQRRFVAPLVLALSFGLAWLIAPPRVADTLADRLFDSGIAQAGTPDPAGPPPSTIDVRLALWEGTAAMIRIRPLLGFGAGQFAIEYPRYRTARELELSSFGRRFQTSPERAHNDYLQVLAELGLPGLVLAAILVFMVLRRTPPGLWGPLFAFFILAGVRAPWTNAPVAALVFLFAGALLRAQHRPADREFSIAPRAHLVKGLLCGMFLIWFGSGQLLAQVASSGYVSRMKSQTDLPGALACVDRALVFRPHDHNLRLVRARSELRSEATLREARRDIEYLMRTARALPAVRIEYALLLNAEGDAAGAEKILRLLLLDDGDNQRAIQVLVTILVRHKHAPEAILVLYHSRHPRTRETLAQTLAGLAEEAKSEGDRSVLQVEQAFVETLDAFADDPKGDAAVAALKRFQRMQSKIASGAKDMRFLVLTAALFLAQGLPAEAAGVARYATGRTLLPTYRRMMEDAIQPLLAMPEWRELLPQPEGSGDR